MDRLRNRKAASLVLVVALLLALTVIVVAAIQLIDLLGGGQQMQRATDAGNLSLARSILVKVAVPLASTGDQVQFNGVSDHSGGVNGVINLRNINRVMGQAFLVSLNAQKIGADGIDLGAASHAQQAVAAAQSLGDSLSQQLAKPSSVQDFFTSVAKMNPTKQFGPVDVSTLGTPQFSYMERTTPSNVAMFANQMPDYDPVTGVSKLYNDKVSKWCTSVATKDYGVRNFINGYLEGINPGSGLPNSYFVPLKPGAKPHLVSQVAFDANNKANGGANAFSWGKPVPNSISLKAQAQSAEGFNGGFGACAIVEPIDANGFGAALPHGFIRIQNGAPSPATGVASGNNKDVFVVTMFNHQVYPVDTNGKPLPYFAGNSDSPLPYNSANAIDYINHIASDNQHGKAPDCSGLNVGFALAGDVLGQNGVSAANCATIGGVGSEIDNVALDNPASQGNTDMHAYNSSDNRMLWARPLIENAYGIQPPQAIGSNGSSINVADILNLKMLSARAEGVDFQPATYQSGIAHIPSGVRGPLPSGQYRVTTDQGVRLESTSAEGLPVNGPLWNFLYGRMAQIDPNWLNYVPDNFKKNHTELDYVLSQDFVPMGGRGYIYYSTSARGGQGGLVLKNETAALADAPWLSEFIGQSCDAKSPSSPTDLKQINLNGDEQIDVSDDWGFPHPYDVEGKICISNWYSYTPSSGWNNLLGQVNMGAINTNCCPEGSTGSGAFAIQYGASGDKLTMPAGCNCQNSGTCDYSGPC
jgi:hypothetical protein